MADNNNNIILFIVEGEKREKDIIDNIEKIFFSKSNFLIYTLPAKQNIYMLWKKLKDDDFETDVVGLLKENSSDADILSNLNREKISEIYLFFDYDGHINNFEDDQKEAVIEEMLLSFNNETENGKLYISYPMVEAVRDFTEGECGNNKDCFIRIEEFGRYKNISAGRSSNPNLNTYDYFVWKSIIDIFSMRISCLYDSEKTIERERYLKEMTPYMIYCLEKKLIEKNHVFILSAFPEFLLDYFPTKFWNENVKHSVNMSKRNNCKRPIFKNV